MAKNASMFNYTLPKRLNQVGGGQVEVSHQQPHGTQRNIGL